jgi:putative nucleotidyltransferase with HDIG domain
MILVASAARARLWIRAALFAVGFALAAAVGYAVSFGSGFTTLWPPAGLLTAVLLLCETSDWPVMLAVGALANVTLDLAYGRSPVVAVGFALGNALAAVIGALLIRRFAGSAPRLETVRGVWCLTGFGALLGGLISATVGVSVIALTSGQTNLLGTWATWWSGYAAAVIIVGSLVLTWATFMQDYRVASPSERKTKLRRMVIAVLASIAIAPACWFVFTATGGTSTWKFTLMPWMLLVGVVLGPESGMLMVFAGAVAGLYGIEATAAHANLVLEAEALKLFQAQAYFALAGVVTLALSVLVAESRRHLTSASASSIRLERMVLGVAEAMGKAVEARDAYTQGHQLNVARVSRQIAEAMRLPSDQVEAIEMAALVHDVGKLVVPAEILTKPGKLSSVEFDLIRLHSESGYEILKDIDFDKPIAEIVLQHHERLDGSGYPNGLRGDEILPEARIIAVADVVEAMASHRPYRPALGVDVALAEVASKPHLYDPEVAKTVVELHDAGELAL